jgi:hypothetical protein
MPAPDAISDLPQRIIDALGIEVEWTVYESDGSGIGFVAGELGVWLTTRDDDWLSALRVEVRVARHVPDGPGVREFCETHNHHGLVGRWVHDPATATVSLVADLPSFNADGAEAGLVEVWAEYAAHMSPSRSRSPSAPSHSCAWAGGRLSPLSTGNAASLPTGSSTGWRTSRSWARTPSRPRRSWNCCDRLHRSYTGVPVVAG